jgi:hypothetical protein
MKFDPVFPKVRKLEILFERRFGGDLIRPEAREGMSTIPKRRLQQKAISRSFPPPALSLLAQHDGPLQSHARGPGVHAARRGRVLRVVVGLQEGVRDLRGGGGPRRRRAVAGARARGRGARSAPAPGTGAACRRGAGVDLRPAGRRAAPAAECFACSDTQRSGAGRPTRALAQAPRPHDAASLRGRAVGFERGLGGYQRLAQRDEPRRPPPRAPGRCDGDARRARRPRRWVERCAAGDAAATRRSALAGRQSGQQGPAA